ncbi:MAG TPA: hypothetical protein VFB43_19620 [Terracidiphilus sp.]|jgi:hypothetical protein|nr:hypothetical protein [Terracidiphilus sp.]
MRLNWLAIALLAMAVPVVSSSSSRAYGAAPQAPGYGDRPGWDAPPSEFREVQRQGFHDGIEGARRDFDHHRRPDVDRREEYRHPHVDRAVREDYREGYRRGYEMAMHHLMGETRY